MRLGTAAIGATSLSIALVAGCDGGSEPATDNACDTLDQRIASCFEVAVEPDPTCDPERAEAILDAESCEDLQTALLDEGKDDGFLVQKPTWVRLAVASSPEELWEQYDALALEFVALRVLASTVDSDEGPREEFSIVKGLCASSRADALIEAVTIKEERGIDTALVVDSSEREDGVCESGMVQRRDLPMLIRLETFGREEDAEAFIATLPDEDAFRDATVLPEDRLGSEHFTVVTSPCGRDWLSAMESIARIHTQLGIRTRGLWPQTEGWEAWRDAGNC